MIKSAFYIAILMWTSIQAFAQQNLVVNGDFEDFSSCPQTVSTPSQTIKEIEKCIGWKAPTYGTSDYFNSCTSNASVSIPTNALGKQSAYNGNGYLGALFTSYAGGGGDDGYTGIYWWEYVQGKLLTPLEQGKTYKFSMEVSLAEGSDLMITELGTYFSSTPILSPNTKPLTVSPQCVFYKPNYFKDTLNWIHLETYFTATGGEQFLTIGNFRDGLATDTLRRFDLFPGLNPYFTYFYIDNVVLIDPTSELPVGNVFTPNGDGINDIWTFPFSDEPGMKKISIINRWGNLIKEGDLNGFNWDGKTNDGVTCSEGTYFYRISDTTLAGFIELMK